MEERPLECSECQKPLHYIYTELVGDQKVRFAMCAECPLLQQKLLTLSSSEGKESGEASLCCGNCSTSLDSVRLGHPLGCPECYDLFEETLISEVLFFEEPSKREKAQNSKDSLHIGRVPGEFIEITPSIRLIALNEALKESLKVEDYEGAAKIRDQIEQLNREQDNGKKSK